MPKSTGGAPDMLENVMVNLCFFKGLVHPHGRIVMTAPGVMPSVLNIICPFGVEVLSQSIELLYAYSDRGL